jgi:AbiU2
MNTERSSAEAVLGDLCRGLARDVYLAEMSRHLLEELDRFGDAINRTGTGKHFFANLQMFLQHELVLSVCRLYEPYSSRNPSRSIPAAARHINVHRASLRIAERERLRKFLGCSEVLHEPSNLAGDHQLWSRFVEHLADLPKPNPDSSRSLDQALILLKTVRDKAAAHHERVDSSLLRVPGWARLAELIDVAREVTEVLADACGEGSYYLEDDANRAARSLVRLLERAGLSASGEPRSV